MARRHDATGKSFIEVRGVDRAGLGMLSPREREVLALAATGLLDKQICAELGFSPNTLRTYWARIRAKVGEAPRSALAVAYVEETSRQSEGEGPDFVIDLDRWTYTRLSGRSGPVEAEVEETLPYDEVLAIIHPEDKPNLMDFLKKIRTNDLTEFFFSVRVITPIGIELSSAFVRVERNDDGIAIRLLCTRAPIVDLRSPKSARLEVGYWQRDLLTGIFTADENFWHIFDLKGTEEDLREAVYNRFHPDEIDLVRNFVDTTVASGKSHARITNRLYHSDGSYRWVTTDLRIESDESGPSRALGAVMAFDHD